MNIYKIAGQLTEELPGATIEAYRSNVVILVVTKSYSTLAERWRLLKQVRKMLADSGLVLNKIGYDFCYFQFKAM